MFTWLLYNGRTWIRSSDSCCGYFAQFSQPALGLLFLKFLEVLSLHTQFMSQSRIHRFWALSFSEFPPHPPNFLLLEQSQTLPVSPQPCRTTTTFRSRHALHRLMITLWKKAIETWILSHLLLILQVSSSFCLFLLTFLYHLLLLKKIFCQ